MCVKICVCVCALTCVCFHMLVERVSLCKASPAAFTLVRLGAGVDVGMMPQVFFRRKAFPTALTHEGLFSWETTTQERYIYSAKCDWASRQSLLLLNGEIVPRAVDAH